jgi:hypothetical protein
MRGLAKHSFAGMCVPKYNLGTREFGNEENEGTRERGKELDSRAKVGPR